MADVHEPEVSSYNMGRIRCKDTKPGMLVRKFLFKNGFRYRLHVKDLPGEPDIHSQFEVCKTGQSMLPLNSLFQNFHVSSKMKNANNFNLPGLHNYLVIYSLGKFPY